MAYDKNNVFAKMLRGEIPAIKVYEDEHALAVMDINPVARGHTLVIPKVEAEGLLDLPAASAGAALIATQKVAKAVKAAMNASGIRVSQHNGASAGQSVFHIHFHIIPHWDDPKSRAAGTPTHGRPGDLKELEGVAKLIRAQL